MSEHGAIEHAPAHPAEEHHPGPATYLLIGLILLILTIMEVAVVYLPALAAVLLPILMVLMVVKFSLVVM